jgi:LPS export ABC transporter protein LptC
MKAPERVSEQTARFVYTLFCIVLALCGGLCSCANDMKTVNKIIDPEEEPDLTAYNVELLYSDSARLQMKLKAPFVQQYAGKKDPRDEFPQGVHVWMYEKTGELKAEIVANWALHDHTTKIWEAKSNVVITNSEGQQIETEQFFWDQKKAEVYSTISTKWTFPNGTVQVGKKGMWAKQDFTGYKLFSGSGPLVLNQE